jgi:small subunit ribosomal protein S20
MANIRSAQKRARQAIVRTQRNTSRRSRVRTAIRKVEEALASGDQTAAQEALRAAQPEIIRGAKKGLYHINRASRKISRLASRVKSL